MVEKLVEKGWGVLAYDARGHGESSKTVGKDKRPNGFMRFGPTGPGSPWEKMIDDVGSAVKFLKEKKGVEKRSLFLIGASMGANVSLNYASLTRFLKGAVLLSPGLKYVGIRTDIAIQRKNLCPVLIIASSNDTYALKSSEKLKQLNSKVQLWTDGKAGHGVQMFDDKLIRRLIKWFEDRQ